MFLKVDAGSMDEMDLLGEMLSSNTDIDINWLKERKLVKKLCSSVIREHFKQKFHSMESNEREKINDKILLIRSKEFTESHSKPLNMLDSRGRHKSLNFTPTSES